MMLFESQAFLAILTIWWCLLVSSSDAVNRGYKQSGGAIDRTKQQATAPPRQFGGAIVKLITLEDEIVSFKVGERDHVRVVVASDNEDVEYSVSEAGQSEFKRMDDIIADGINPGIKTTEDLHGLSVHEEAIKLHTAASGDIQIQASVKHKRRGRGRFPRSLSESTTVAIVNPGSSVTVCFETTEKLHFVGESIDLKISVCDKTSNFVYPYGVVQGTIYFKSGEGTSIDIPASGKDGWTTVPLPGMVGGTHTFQVNIDGSDDNGATVFERQGNGVLFVSEKQLESLESATIEMDEIDGHEYALLKLTVNLANGYVPSEEDHFLVLADIVDGDNKDIVEASAMADLEETSTGWVLELIIQPEWFETSSDSVYSIEYLRISCAESSVPLIIAKDVPIEAREAIVVRNRRLSESPEDRDLRMTQGIRPSTTNDINNNLRRELQQNGILAIHGYCSGEAWENYLGSGVDKFKDFYQNRSHDEYARLLRSYAEEKYQGCSIIAHSQGGAVALHLYTYYWSCLDNAGPGRLIQTVGTPYQGTSLAGGLAALGEVLGIGCGINYDLTYAGAANWLAGIPSWARSKVYYWTTSFKDRWWAYDYCQIALDVLLGDPDDGTTEKAFSQLPGGNNRGHKEGWCHTSAMRDPAQTSDSSRNAEMLAQAAQ